MSNLSNIRSSIIAVVMENDPEDIVSITDDIMSIFLCESWTHVQGETVYLDSLTDREFRILAMWTDQSAKHYTRPIAHIKDMREIFPGLSLSAANYFVRRSHVG